MRLAAARPSRRRRPASRRAATRAQGIEVAALALVRVGGERLGGVEQARRLGDERGLGEAEQEAGLHQRAAAARPGRRRSRRRGRRAACRRTTSSARARSRSRSSAAREPVLVALPRASREAMPRSRAGALRRAGGSGQGAAPAASLPRRARDLQHAEVVVALADDLQADRQAGAGVAAVDARGRLLAHVVGDGEADVLERPRRIVGGRRRARPQRRASARSARARSRRLRCAATAASRIAPIWLKPRNTSAPRERGAAFDPARR